MPTAAGKWQEYAKGNGGESVESTSGAEFTGFDRDGSAHQMIRPASTVASESSDEGTIADPREKARNAKEEVCIPACFLVTKTDGRTSVMRDPDLLEFEAVAVLLSSYHHMLVGRRSQTMMMMMMMMKTTIGESSKSVTSVCRLLG